MKKIYLLVIVCGVICLLSNSAFAQVSTFPYTAGVQTYTVPAGTFAVGVDATGGCGGIAYQPSGTPTGPISFGGRTQCTMAVTPGQVLYISVGGAGQNDNFGSNTTGGFNGGVNGTAYGAASGGGSDVRFVAGTNTSVANYGNQVLPYTATNRPVVAGGGGGGGDYYGTGGSGGGLTGGLGLGGESGFGAGGSGGTQTGPGPVGSNAGVLGVGGQSSSYNGGGGGYWGGNGRSGSYGGGGGGSSYSDPTICTNVIHTQGYTLANGNGRVIITPQASAISATPSSLAFNTVTSGTTSPIQLFALSAYGLTSTGSLTLTPPANYQLSLDNINWSASGVAITYNYSATLFPGYTYNTTLFNNTVFYARFVAPGAAGPSPGNITVTGGGLAATLNIPVTGTSAAACSGTPTAGTATINGGASASGSATTALTLNVPSATVGGNITYQWQVSTTSAVAGFNNIIGANTASYVYSGLGANSWFQCIVSCGTFSATSGTAAATFALPASSCTPSCSSGNCSWPAGTGGSPFLMTGGNGTSISDASNCGSGTGGSSWYYNNTSTSITLNPGGVYSATYGLTNLYYSTSQTWIDFNDNGIFETSESVGGVYLNTPSGSGGRQSYNVIIPPINAGTVYGAHRMRVMAAYTAGVGSGNVNYPEYPSMNPCPSSTTPVYYADARDYTVIIANPLPTMTATPATIAIGNVAVGTSSAPVGFFALSGINLNPSFGIITIGSSSSNFLLSTNGTTWSNTISMAYSNSVVSTNIYVQFNPLSSGPASSTITVNGGGIASALSVTATGTGVTACSGVPVTGTAAISTTVANPSSPITLSLPVGTVGGLTYQWQSSTSGTLGTFSNIAGAITQTYSFVGVSAATYYQCIVTCPSGSNATSNIVSLSLVPSEAGSSCTIPPAADYCQTCYWNVAYTGYPLVIAGTTAPGINDASVVGASSYADLSATQYCVMNAGSTYTATAGGEPGDGLSLQFWIDFNGDGMFQTTESVGGGNIGTTRSNITLTIPSGVSNGVKRMRVEAGYNISDVPIWYEYPSMPPCPSMYNPYYYEVRDYAVIFGTAPPTNASPCAGPINAGIVSPSVPSSCVAFSPNLFDVGEPVVYTGVNYQWESATSASGPWTAISGATGQGYVPPAITAVGTTYYRDSVTCLNGPSTAVTPAQAIVLNPPPTITGTTLVCAGLTTTLSATPSGGTWVSSNTANATVGSGSGIVSGVTPSSLTTITYTAPTTCVNTITVTMNSNPAVPGGTTSVCSSTTGTLTDGSGSGTWTSGNTALATVVSSTGVLTGVSAGTPLVTFTLGATGCSNTGTVTVNAAASITGSPSICIGYTGSLSASIAGGTWSSSNTGVATINSSGVVSSVSIGSTTINYITPVTGCVATLTFNVTSPPSTFAVTGGGSFCSGPPTVYVGLNGSGPGVTYTLYNTLSGAVGSVTAGALGGAFEFGTEPAGSYYVVAAAGSPCATVMTGTVTVTALPLPTAYAVTGGGGYCPGGTGVNVFLNNSTIGINYQLFVGTIPVGTTVPGTSAPINFGLQTTSGTYTVVATNPLTGCTNTMSGSVAVSVFTPPATQTVTGGGNYCVGGTGYAIGLLSSASGTNYQLTLGGVNVGSPVPGTGSAISFGTITAAGVYNVVATQTSTGCSATMSGTATITVTALPTAFTVTGGGGYCFGTTTGVPVSLNGSTVGINYQLYYTSTAVGATPVPVGSPVPGTNVAITFTSGSGTGGTYVNVGSYSVVATGSASPFCSNNMFGSVAVFTNPLPAISSVTGGGNYCAGGTGLAVGLSGSVVGTTYNLYDGATLVSAASGTGGSFNFGTFTASGTYTATAITTATGCNTNMAGSTIINIIPLPNVNTVGGGGAYCTGTSPTGVSITLSGSSTGINYNLYNGGSLISTTSGTGSPVSFTNVSAGSYTIVAVTTTTPVCTSNMTGSIIVNANTPPTLYSVTGGGSYCANAIPAGVHVGLSSSNTGITYALYKVGGAVVTTMAGVGGALDFGLQTTTSTTTYKIAAMNTATGCADTMSGSAVVGVNALPNATYFVTASGGTPSGAQYCFGGTGVNIGTSSSDAGINYQLASGGVPTSAILPGVAATALNFGPVTGAGPYTVIATNLTTSCSTLITGSITVTINPVPPPFSVTGGGAYCGGALGTTGSLVGLSSSSSSINYQIFNGGAPGATILGTGGALNYGLEPAGNYTIVATNPVTTCSSVMSGSALVTASSVPSSTYIVTGGGAYCTGGTGVPIGLSSSSPGVYYQLMLGGAPIGGGPSAGTGIALSFGSTFTVNGSYYVIGTNATTGCSATMTGSVTVTPSTLPAPHTVNGGGNYCPAGTGVVVGLNGSNIGTTYQLYNGSTLVPGGSVPGTGSPVSFGLLTTTGTYTVVAYNGCYGTMAGSATVGIYSLPAAYDVSGGGNYCPGGTGVNIELSGSATGLTYTLQNGAGPVATLTGSGFSLNFTGVTASGTYTIYASNPATGCSSNMTGTANVVINTPPTAFNVTGGGNYCFAGSGMLVGLDGSVTGTEYQLIGGSGPVGSPVHGTGSAISFGLQTAAGTYTVVATSLSTTCTNIMSGSATINVVPLPLVQSVSTGGNYCAGGAGIDITLGSSQTGVTYQLYNGATAVPGGSITGSSAGLNFGFQTAAGTYTIVGTDDVSSCSNTMSGSSIIVVDPLPVAYIASGGGNYCAGGAGLHIVLSGSNTGINYQLVNGGPVGSPKPGIGSALDFGLQTGAGSYTIIASNATTGCTNTMTGDVSIAINSVPNPYTVTSSASNYCSGGAGVDVQLSGSDAGVQYQLYNGPTTFGAPVLGTGFDIDFGLQTSAGTYTVVAINPGTACSSNMTSAATIVINPLPTAYTVVGGGNYCSGGTGAHVGLSSSNTGISYQLYIGGGIAVGLPMMGTGLALDFGAQTASGTYTIVATNMGTTCTNNMSGSATIVITSLPAVNTVTGGGPYCAGAAGVHVGLSGSTGGVVYQLYNGSSLVGAPVAGTGIAVDFGLQTAAGTYTVMGLNSATACSNGMAGSATVTINSLPSAYAVTGGGNYCPGADGVPVGLGGSANGISYQLYNGSAPAGDAMLGTGTSVNFGLQTAGTYSAIATNSATGCSSNMSGTVSVGLNPLPGVYSVIGGGNYCAGGTGVHVGLTGSATGINYQLFSTSGSAGFPVAGTGGPLDFGAQTVAGVYTVVATNGTTGCTNNMAGSTSIVVNSPVSPSVTVSTGVGDVICNGHTVTISTTVANGGSSPVFSWSINGSPVSGSGSTYSYLPADGDVVGVSMTSDAICATPATVGNSITLSVLPNANPTISIAAIPGDAVCQGTPVTFNNINSFGGTPTFTWIVNGMNSGSASSDTYTPANGDVVYCVMTSTYLCRLENTVTSNHITMEVDDSLVPTVTITAYPGTNFTPGENITVTASVINGGSTPSYQWFINGVPVPGANAASYTSSNFAGGDSVTCLVTASGGCTGLSAFNSIRLVSNTGVNQVAINNSNIQLVPNPNNGIFTIKGTLGTTNDEEVSIEISDMLGQVIYNDKVMVHGGNINQKVQLSSAVANGMYILSLSSASANNVFHVVIEQ